MWATGGLARDACVPQQPGLWAGHAHGSCAAQRAGACSIESNRRIVLIALSFTMRPSLSTNLAPQLTAKLHTLSPLLQATLAPQHAASAAPRSLLAGGEPHRPKLCCVTPARRWALCLPFAAALLQSLACQRFLCRSQFLGQCPASTGCWWRTQTPRHQFLWFNSRHAAAILHLIAAEREESRCPASGAAAAQCGIAG